jgi:glycosyltransferase involved in cell wall biosynthesis
MPVANTPKVLQFICSTGFYGAERWILALCKNTEKADCIYSLAVTDEENSQDLELVKHFKRDCGDAIALPMANKFDFSVVGKLARHIQQNNIDVIHTHGYKSDILGVLAAKKAGIPVVVTPHGFENAADFKLRAFIWLGCQAMRFADKVVPLSPALMNDVKGFGVKAPKLEYIQNGVDLSEVEYARDHFVSEPKEKFRVGFIGQMISRKNIKDLLDVFADMHQQRSNVELVMLGDGDSRQALEQYANTLSCASDIHFLGYRDDRLAYLKSFDIFAMTSTLEGIPRCLMEACAMGTPVVSYDIDGVDQLITHNKTGLLAPLKDKQALTKLFLEVFDEPERALALGRNASEYVNKHYAASRMAKEYLVLFGTLIANKHKEDV